MATVRGVGGIFFTSLDPARLRGWFVDPDGNKVELWQMPLAVPAIAKGQG